MIRSFRDFYSREIRPRRREIATEPEFFGALIAAVAAAWFGDRVAVAGSNVGDVVTVVLAYAAVAFGFCLAGMTVAMTLPDQDFATQLAQREASEGTKAARASRTSGFAENAYSRLLFVFSWTAVLHWMAIAIGFIMLIVRGYNTPLLPAGACTGTRALVGLLVFFLVYASTQFLVTLITLSQVGNAYITELRRRSRNH